MTVRGGRGPREPMVRESVRSPKPYVRAGRYGRGPGDPRRSGPYGDRGGGLRGLIGFVALLGVLAIVILVALGTVARPLLVAIVVPLAEENPGALRIGMVADLVREDIGPALTAPASNDPTEVEFVVDQGDTIVTLAPRLIDAGVVSSERAFLFEARTRNLAANLRAGRFLLRKDMTPAQVVVGLVENRVVVTTRDITFREGLRLEQMTAKLQAETETRIDPAEFYTLVTEPPATLLADYPWLGEVLAEGATLEGFLYPATYSVRVDALAPTDAEELVRMMLDTFFRRVGPDRLAVPETRGLTFYQVLTLASIVEREAVLVEEKPLIAGVYQNRIDRIPAVPHGLLQADPTVIYAADTVNLGAYSEEWVQYVFWTVPSGPGLADQPLPDRLERFNTYRVAGLPPAPIASPTVSSIDAALAPDTEERFAFFVAIPEGQGTRGAHDFSKTIAEHEQKLRTYGYR